jgi:hypothetical protein
VAQRVRLLLGYPGPARPERLRWVASASADVGRRQPDVEVMPDMRPRAGAAQG